MGIKKYIQNLMALSLCLIAGLSAQQSEQDPLTVELKLAQRWKRHLLPGGIHLSLPPDFRVNATPKGKVEVIGYKGKMSSLTPYCLIQPFITNRDEAAGKYLRRVILPKYFKLPDAAIVRIKAPDPNHATALIRYAVNHTQRYVLIHCATQDRTGMAYFLSAPLKDFSQTRKVLARIAMSIRYGNSNNTKGLVSDWDPGKRIAFVSWREPKEGAFSLDIPHGWQVTGSLIKAGGMDLKPKITIISPDNRLILFINDAKCGNYSRPAPTLRVQGLFEGHPQFRSDGLTMPIRKLIPGSEFLTTTILPFRFNLQQTIALERITLPTLARSLPTIKKSTIEASGVHFTAKRNKENILGFAYCLTRSWSNYPDLDHWSVPALAGWLGPHGLHQIGAMVLHRALNSISLNPNRFTRRPGWSQKKVSQLNQTFHCMGKLIDSRSRLGKKILARQTRASGPGKGRLKWRDPTTGELFLAARGHNYFWRRLPDSGKPKAVAIPDLDLSALLCF